MQPGFGQLQIVLKSVLRTCVGHGSAWPERRPGAFSLGRFYEDSVFMKTPWFPNPKAKDQGRLFSLCCPRAVLQALPSRGWKGCRCRSLGIAAVGACAHRLVDSSLFLSSADSGSPAFTCQHFSASALGWSRWANWGCSWDGEAVR